MNKLIKGIVVCLSIFGGQLSAQAQGSAKLYCKGKFFSDVTVELKAEALQNWQDGGSESRMVDPQLTLVDPDRPQQFAKQVGRAEYWSSDENYKPRKYRDHVRFDSSLLVDAKTFGRFFPIDLCTLNVLIPKKVIGRTGTFTAPVVVNCDQGGGTWNLNCKLTRNQ